MAGLKKEKVDELQEAFTMHCQPDKRIPLNLLGTVIRCTGGSPSDAQLQSISREYEARGVKTLEFGDVLKIVGKYGFEPESADQLRDCFRTFDKDGNGFLNAAELRHVLSSLGEKLTDEDVDELIRDTDLTGDGLVCIEDMVKLLLSCN